MRLKTMTAAGLLGFAPLMASAATAEGGPEAVFRQGEASWGELASFRALPGAISEPKAYARTALDQTLGLDLRGAASVSAYDRLAAMFEAAKGKVPAEQELRGWRAGRLFAPDDPNRPFAALLAGETGEQIAGGGPIFGRVFKLLAMRATDATPPEYFDDLRPDAQESVRFNIRNMWNGISTPDYTKTGVTFQVAYDRKSVSNFELRKLDGYLILREEDSEGKVKFSWFYQKTVKSDPVGK